MIVGLSVAVCRPFVGDVVAVGVDVVESDGFYNPFGFSGFLLGCECREELDLAERVTEVCLYSAEGGFPLDIGCLGEENVGAAVGGDGGVTSVARSGRHLPSVNLESLFFGDIEGLDCARGGAQAHRRPTEEGEFTCYWPSIDFAAFPRLPDSLFLFVGNLLFRDVESGFRTVSAPALSLREKPSCGAEGGCVRECGDGRLGLGFDRDEFVVNLSLVSIFYGSDFYFCARKRRAKRKNGRSAKGCCRAEMCSGRRYDGFTFHLH